MDGSFRRPADPSEPSGPTIEDERRPGPAVFAVAPVGRRRRFPDRALALGAIAALVVGLAVVKPWADPADRSAFIETSEAEPSASLESIPVRSEPPRPLLGRTRLPTWTEVIAQLDPHGAWGVRVLSDAPTSSVPVIRLSDDTRLAVGWTPAQPGGLVRVGGTTPVRMLAITTPNDEAPLDVRVWRRVRWTEEPIRVAVQRLRGDPGTGESLLVSPEILIGEDPAWTQGTYRFELLLADRIAWIDVSIPGPKLSDSSLRWTARADRITPGQQRSSSATLPATVLDPMSAPIPVGVAGSIVVGLPTVLRAPLEPYEAWLGARAGERPDEPATLAPVRQPDVAALGVALPPGTEVTSLRATRIGGVPAEIASRMVVDPDGGRVVVLSPQGKGGWLAGTYRIDVGWSEPGGRAITAAYHVDLDPGPAAATPRLLAAVRGWARHAGGQGLVVGTVEPLEGGPAAAAIRLLPQEPGSAVETVEAQGGRCRAGGVMADSIQAILGVAHRVDEPVDRVTVERLFVGGRTLPVPVRASIDPVPGLAVMTPVDPGGWQVGHYRIVLGGPDGLELRHVVCLGPGPGARADVPAAASSLRAFSDEAARRG